jgi:hypothetical protein
MPGGRPSKYNPERNPEVIDLMSQGASVVEVAAMLDVSRQTIYEWMDVHPEFSYTIKKGFELCQSWWEAKGRKNLENKDFNYTGWFMNMKNRFYEDWRDRKDVDHTSKGEKVNIPVISFYDTEDEAE